MKDDDNSAMFGGKPVDVPPMPQRVSTRYYASRGWYSWNKQIVVGQDFIEDKPEEYDET